MQRLSCVEEGVLEVKREARKNRVSFQFGKVIETELDLQNGITPVGISFIRFI